MFLDKIPSPEQIDENISALEKGISITPIEKEAISVILQTASELGNNITVRIVGGWVRDKILGKNSNDIDLAVENVTGDEFGKKLQSHFPQNSSKYLTIVEYEGQPSVLWVARAFIFDDFGIDVCRLRTEEYPDAPPSEKQGTPYEDSVGRDFTINSLFFNLNTNKVEDYANGISDLKKGILRSGIDPNRTFAFELQRIIRAFRFSIILPLKMDDEIRKAIPKLKERFIQKAPRFVCSKQIVRTLLNSEFACKLVTEMNQLDFFNTYFDPNEELNIDVEDVIKRIRAIHEGDPAMFLSEIYRVPFKNNPEKTTEIIKFNKFNEKIEEKILSILSKSLQ